MNTEQVVKDETEMKGNEHWTGCKRWNMNESNEQDVKS